MCIGGEHDEIEVVFIVHELASFTPAKVCHVCKVSDIQLSNLRVGTIFGIHVNVARGWIRCNFPRST